MKLINSIARNGVQVPAEALPQFLDVSYYNGSEYLCYTFQDGQTKINHENWLMPQNDYDADLANSTNAQCVLDTDGVMYKTKWGKHETSEGVYDFSSLITAIEYTAARGKKFIPRVGWKSYNDSANPPANPPIPLYIVQDHAKYGGNVNSGGLYINYSGTSPIGWSARLDNNNVLTRFNAFVTAMAEAISSYPNVVGFAFDESIWGVVNGSVMPDGLTTQNVYDANVAMYQHAIAAWPGKSVYPFVNFLDAAPYSAGLQPARNLLQHTVDIGMGVGVTDTHRIPEMGRMIQPVYLSLPLTTPNNHKQFVVVDYLSTGADDSQLQQRMILNAIQANRLGADITVWYNRGGASSNYWAAMKQAMAYVTRCS